MGSILASLRSLASRPVAGPRRGRRRSLFQRGGPPRRDFFFVHVPRTGGSSIWHSLAHEASERGRDICDVFHDIRQRPAPAPSVTDVIRETRGKLGDRSCIYHVHDCVRLPCLGGPDAVAATVLRDPIDRHVSHVIQLRGVVTAPTTDAGLIATLQANLGSESMRLLRNPTISARNLALALADCCPRLRNHYDLWFSTLLGADEGGTHNVVATGPARMERLARRIRSHFALIGMHDDLEGFYGGLCRLAGLDPPPTRLSRSINRGNIRPDLTPEDRERLRDTFALDYALLDELGLHIAPRPSATPRHVTRRLPERARLPAA